ncbi:MAG: hypothetical protein ACF8LK_09545, partial [Phycisphaerales bacterium JB041]
LLGSGPIRDRDTRVSRVLAGADASAQATLSRDDAEALDAWMLAGLDAQRVPASLRDRARVHDAIASLVSSPSRASVPQFTRAQLIERTLSRVAEAGQSRESSVTILQRNRLADFLSVAAVLLIAVSILWPVMSSVRESSRQAACAGNMRSVANAMGLYTADNDEMLPMVTAGFGKRPWWNVGRDPSSSNSANLYALSKQPYARLADLACPGNPRAITVPRSPDAKDWGALEEISYSYRVMAHPERSIWGQPSQLVIVADRSPVVLRAVRGQVIFPLESSPNHQGQGQHGLTADGAAQWLTTPALSSGDNIWLPKPIEMVIDLAARRRGIEPIRGTEAPAGRQDSFVGP